MKLELVIPASVQKGMALCISMQSMHASISMPEQFDDEFGAVFVSTALPTQHALERTLSSLVFVGDRGMVDLSSIAATSLRVVTRLSPVLLRNAKAASIEILTYTGSIDTEALDAQQLMVRSMSGTIRTGRITAACMTVLSKSGMVLLGDIGSSRAIISNESGDVSTGCIDCKQQLEIKSRSGRILVGKVTTGTALFSTEYGKIDARNVFASGGVIVRSRSGGINLVDVALDSLWIDSINGSVGVSGSIRDELSVKSVTGTITLNVSFFDGGASSGDSLPGSASKRELVWAELRAQAATDALEEAKRRVLVKTLSASICGIIKGHKMLEARTSNGGVVLELDPVHGSQADIHTMAGGCNLNVASGFEGRFVAESRVPPTVLGETVVLDPDSNTRRVSGSVGQDTKTPSSVAVTSFSGAIRIEF
nr:hypothetical protein HK105_003894 [Polyrhizophydium stewartii]